MVGWISNFSFLFQLLVYPVQIDVSQPETCQITFLHLPANAIKVLIQRGINLFVSKFLANMSYPFFAGRLSPVSHQYTIYVITDADF